MRVAKAWYFSYFSALSCIFPFLNLFFRRLGLGERSIGLVGAARPLVSLPAGSIWSGAADKSRRHRAVCLLCFAASASARLAIAPVGALWSGKDASSSGAGSSYNAGTATSSNNGDSASGAASLAPLLAMVLLTEFFAAPVTIIVDSAVMAACTQAGDYGKQRLFGALGWGFFSFVSGAAVSRSGSLYTAFALHAALVAAAVLPTYWLPFGPLHAKLDQQGGEESGGKLGGSGGSAAEEGGRGGGGGAAKDWQQADGWEEEEEQQQQEDGLGSANGSGSRSAGAGLEDGGLGAARQELELQASRPAGRRSVERFDSALEAQSLLSPKESGGKPATAAVAAASSGSKTHSSTISGSLDSPSHAASPRERQPAVRYWSGVARLLRKPEAAVFMAMSVFMGVGVGNIEGYLFLYLDELGGSPTLMGLSLSVTCAAESLVFYFLPALLRLGTRRCFHLVFAGFLLRMGLYSLLPYAPTPWLVLPAEVLHGVTFALAWGAGSAYCAQLSPPGLESTTQGLFQGAYFGLGVAAGSFLGGHVYQRLGAQAVYLVACAVLAAGWLLCSLAQLAVWLLGWEEEKPEARYQLVDVDVEMSGLGAAGEEGGVERGKERAGGR